jgi:hypothetical protein
LPFAQNFKKKKKKKHKDEEKCFDKEGAALVEVVALQVGDTY